LGTKEEDKQNKIILKYMLCVSYLF